MIKKIVLNVMIRMYNSVYKNNKIGIKKRILLLKLKI